jgi:hypothetical protein
MKIAIAHSSKAVSALHPAAAFSHPLEVEYEIHKIIMTDFLNWRFMKVTF